MKGKSCKSNRTRGSRPAARMLAAALALIFIVQFVGCNSCSKPGSDDIDLPNVSLEPVPATKGPGTSSSPSVVSRNGYSVSTSNIYATMVAAQVLDGAETLLTLLLRLHTRSPLLSPTPRASAEAAECSFTTPKPINISF